MRKIDPARPETWPVNPESSKGERIKDAPTPAHRIAEAEKWMEILPPPPRPLADQTDDDVVEWVRLIADKGGIPALDWVYDPANWPYGPVIRGRLQHVIGSMKRALDEDARSQREVAAIRQREEMQQRDRELRKAKGWA